MSVISSWLSKIYGSKFEGRCLMVGLDASGRTTLLYKWKIGEVVSTIPTIGFNVETVEFKNTSITFWDVGGCDKIRPLWRHYFVNTQVILFFVDSNDRARMEEVEWSLGLLHTEDELRDAAYCVIANKQDLPNAMSAKEISERLNLEVVFRNRQWAIFPISATKGENINAPLEWIANVLQNKLPGDAPRIMDKPTPPQNPEEILLEKWLTVEDEPDDVFLEKFQRFELETWDHRTHLRIGWLYLTKEGRREGMKRIFEGIRAFIAHSPRTARARGSTFHETLTYFWVHMIHYAMAATKNPTNEFKSFLVLNPQLSNGGLFLHYYRKETMMNNPEAREKVVLPDLKPLPSILSDVSSKTEIAPLEKRVEKKDEELDDDAFLKAFLEKSLKGWGHETFLRVIYVYLTKKGRKEGIKEILKELEAFMGSGFHLTITYFWIQMIDFTLAKNGKNGVTPGFRDLLAAAPALRDERLYLEHYKKETIYGKEAEKAMVLPDKKNLPSLLPGK